METNQPERILVIDDDPDILTSWKFTLKSMGEAPPVTATSGLELKKTNIDFNKIKLAIVDFQFDGSDTNGADIIQFLHSKGIDRIYLSTGYADNEDVCRKSRAMGIDGIIPKPVNIDRIKEILAKYFFLRSGKKLNQQFSINDSGFSDIVWIDEIEFFANYRAVFGINNVHMNYVGGR